MDDPKYLLKKFLLSKWDSYKHSDAPDANEILISTEGVDDRPRLPQINLTAEIGHTPNTIYRMKVSHHIKAWCIVRSKDDPTAKKKWGMFDTVRQIVMYHPHGLQADNVKNIYPGRAKDWNDLSLEPPIYGILFWIHGLYEISVKYQTS